MSRYITAYNPYANTSSMVNPQLTQSSPSWNLPNQTNHREKRRTQVACARCRKRKIKCSGDPGDGSGCSNCQQSGVELSECHFNRIGSMARLIQAPDGPLKDGRVQKYSEDKSQDTASKASSRTVITDLHEMKHSGLEADQQCCKCYFEPSLIDPRIGYPSHDGYFPIQELSRTSLQHTNPDLPLQYLYHTQYPEIEPLSSSTDHAATFPVSAKQPTPWYWGETEVKRQLPPIPTRQVPSAQQPLLAAYYRFPNPAPFHSNSRYSPYLYSNHGEMLHENKSTPETKESETVVAKPDDALMPHQQLPASNDGNVGMALMHPLTSPSPPEDSDLDRVEGTQCSSSSTPLLPYPIQTGTEEQINAYGFTLDSPHSYAYHKQTEGSYGTLVSGQQYISPFGQQIKDEERREGHTSYQYKGFPKKAQLTKKKGFVY